MDKGQKALIRKLLVTAAVAAVAIALAFWMNSLNQEEGEPTQKKQEKISEDLIMKSLNSAPLAFEENRGQTDEQVKFLAKRSGLTVFFTPEEIVYKMTFSAEGDDALGAELEKSAGKALVIRQQFVDADPGVRISGQDQLEGKVNYFIGNDPDKWVKEAPTFSSVIYSGLYPGIDLVISGEGGELSLLYKVESGANPDQIKIAVHGIEGLSLAADGSLVMPTELGNFGQKPFSAYQEASEEEQVIDVVYNIVSDNTYAFSLGDYNKDEILYFAN